MLRENKGISLITAVMTVLLIIIILSTITYTAINNTKLKRINAFYSDLRVVTDEVQLYFAQHDKLPVKDVCYTITEELIQKKIGEDYELYASLESANLGFILKEGKTDYSLDNLYNPNDYNPNLEEPNSRYYEIDLSKFDNLTLNNPDGIYLVNENSKTVYYYTGVKIGGEVYNKLPLKYDVAVPKYLLIFKNGATTILEKENVSKVFYLKNEPTIEGYEFSGWYYDEGCVFKAKAGDTLKEDTILYAGWE